jgi:hypothetical protein
MSSKAELLIQSWAGLIRHEIEIVGQTPKKYRVKWIKDEPFIPPKSGTVRQKGDIFLVPKTAVRIIES